MQSLASLAVEMHETVSELLHRTAQTPPAMRRWAEVRACGDYCTLPLWKTRDRWLDGKLAQQESRQLCTMVLAAGLKPVVANSNAHCSEANLNDGAR